MELAQRLKKLRQLKNLTVSEVARKLSVAPSTYREWEQGRQIKGEPYEKLALIFDVSVTEVITGERPMIEPALRQIEKIIKKIRIYL